MSNLKAAWPRPSPAEPPRAVVELVARWLARAGHTAQSASPPRLDPRLFIEAEAASLRDAPSSSECAFGPVSTHPRNVLDPHSIHARPTLGPRQGQTVYTTTQPVIRLPSTHNLRCASAVHRRALFLAADEALARLDAAGRRVPPRLVLGGRPPRGPPAGTPAELAERVVALMPPAGFVSQLSPGRHKCNIGRFRRASGSSALAAPAMFSQAYIPSNSKS